MGLALNAIVFVVASVGRITGVAAGDSAVPMMADSQGLLRGETTVRLLDEPSQRFADRPHYFMMQRGITLVSAEERDRDQYDPSAPPEPTPADELDKRAKESGERSEESSLEKNFQIFRAPISAAKMTIRRDPSSSRYLRDNPENGSIKAVQDDLKKSELRSDVPTTPNTRFMDISYAEELPYGKYLNISHGPLLFEDIPAERYGEVWNPCLQPVVSFTKFMGTIPILPYKITTNYWAAKHNGALYAYDHQYNLRPGILEGQYFPSVDAMKQYPAANLAGGAVEAGTVMGLIFFLP